MRYYQYCMPNTRRALGSFGETAAAAHLNRHGYSIVARGWRCAVGELDLVAQHDQQLVFVEVRTRRGSSLVSPEESITPTKQARLIALAHAYLDVHNLSADSAWRIDVIAVVIDQAGRIARLTHLQDAVGEQ